MSKIINWLKYYRASLVDGNRGVKNAILSQAIQRDTDRLSFLTNTENS